MKATFTLTGFMAILVGLINLEWFNYNIIHLAVFIIGFSWCWLFVRGVREFKKDQFKDILTDPKYKPKGRWE